MDINPVPETVCGMKIVESILAVSQDPVKVHIAKSWMSSQYHNRIQKKWNKRYGYNVKPCMIVMKDINTVAVHPDLMPTLLQHIRSNAI